MQGNRHLSGMRKQIDKRMAKHLGDIMGVVGNSQDESIIGETVYHFIKFPSDDSICIVEVNGTYQFYVKDGVEEKPTETKDTMSPVAETSNANITLEYITELQTKVSAAMSNGELSFVSSSAI